MLDSSPYRLWEKNVCCFKPLTLCNVLGSNSKQIHLRNLAALSVSSGVPDTPVQVPGVGREDRR